MEWIRPMDIEQRSFDIISEELADVPLDPETEPVLKRVIHTTADFEYVNNLLFSPGVVPHAISVLQQGATIITDTEMACSGINKAALKRLGIHARCFMADPEVAREAKEREITRAWVSMEKAAKLPGPLIFAVGNAPTALISLHELMEKQGFRPALIIGVPVGFVNVVESKELILASEVFHIVARGRKGGSNVAAAIVNALLYLASPRI